MHELVSKQGTEELCTHFVIFVEKNLRVISEHNNEIVRNWAPTERDFCCTQCGINQ
jgi:hypothetical protein